MCKFLMGVFKTGILFALIFSSMAYCTPIPQIEIGWNGGNWQSNYSEPDINLGHWGQFNVSRTILNKSIETTAELQFSDDMFVLVNFTVRNVSNVVQTYDLSFTVPIPDAISNIHYGGSTGGSITDNGFYPNMAVVSTEGGRAFYSATVDGVEVLPIYSAPSAWQTSYNGQTINIGAMNIGLGGPSLPGGAALSTIGINHHFTLSPGDVMAVTSYFQIIPEPATLAILGLSSLVLLIRRR